VTEHKRITKDEYFLAMAVITSARSTCMRRKVGAVAVDGNNFVIGTGFNDVPAKAPHCTEQPCKSANGSSGCNLDDCRAIHAEANMLAHCLNPRMIHTVYLTVTPCVSCIKLLLATSCERIVALAEYPHSQAKEEWLANGRDWDILDINWENSGLHLLFSGV